MDYRFYSRPQQTVKHHQGRNVAWVSRCPSCTTLKQSSLLISFLYVLGTVSELFKQVSSPLVLVNVQLVQIENIDIYSWYPMSESQRDLDITPCSLLKNSGRFRGTYSHHLERRIKPAWSKACCLLHAGFLFGLFFNTDDGGDMFHRNLHCLSTDYVALYCRR
jgi:hypothetical protein